jgi:hypothetical protein
MPIRPENRHLYPANWKELSRQIRARDGNNCQFCGVENYSFVYRGSRRVRIVLTVANLDWQPENCDPENLAALCQRCHNAYDAEERAFSRFAREWRARQAAQATPQPPATPPPTPA